MAITAEQVVTTTSFYIPETNSLSTTELEILAQNKIDLHGDEDALLPKVQCEFLKAVAIVNGTISSVGAGSLKRERLGDHEKEYFNGSVADWDTYLSKVKNDICPLLGVQGSTFVIGATVNSSEEVSPITSCSTKQFL